MILCLRLKEKKKFSYTYLFKILCSNIRSGYIETGKVHELNMQKRNQKNSVHKWFMNLKHDS